MSRIPISTSEPWGSLGGESRPLVRFTIQRNMRSYSDFATASLATEEREEGGGGRGREEGVDEGRGERRGGRGREEGGEEGRERTVFPNCR